MDIPKKFILGAVEFILSVVTTFPTWLFGRPVNLSGFLPVHHATCHVAPEVQKHDLTLYQQLKALRAQRRKNYEKIQRVSATVAVFRGRNTDTPKILLLQARRWPSSPYGGKWEMTGGGVDMVPHETTLRAAEREAHDEANIEVSSIDAFVGDHYFYIPRLAWLGHNVKIMFIGQVKGGDAGFRNIKLNYFEHERWCWATEQQLAAMTDGGAERPKFVMDGQEARPSDDQWKHMQYVSREGRQLALQAFEKLREVKAKEQ